MSLNEKAREAIANGDRELATGRSMTYGDWKKVRDRQRKRAKERSERGRDDRGR
jgi:hypothetical protein